MIAAILGIIDKILGFFTAQSAANAATVQKQAGADATTAAGLATVNKVQAAQEKALVEAPDSVSEVADLARRNGL
jgi:hypothetical protein